MSQCSWVFFLSLIRFWNIQYLRCTLNNFWQRVSGAFLFLVSSVVIFWWHCAIVVHSMEAKISSKIWKLQFNIVAFYFHSCFFALYFYFIHRWTYLLVCRCFFIFCLFVCTFICVYMMLLLLLLRKVFNNFLPFRKAHRNSLFLLLANNRFS